MGIWEKVNPLAVLALHQQFEDGEMPSVLFVKYKDSDKLILPWDVVRTTEQPDKAALRIGNTLFELGLDNVRVRCYYSNFIEPSEELGNSLAVYYTLKLWVEEIELLDRVLADLDDSKLYGYEWVSVGVDILSDKFNQQMIHCWRTIRRSVASNYGMKIEH